MPDKKLTDKWLEEIRKKISCPQFGDEHYGAWGILNKDQRFAIKRMLDFIGGQEAYINRLQAENSNLQEKNSNLTSDLTSLQNDLTSAKAENERLKTQLYLEKYTDVAKRTIKAEAYKECIEKVKETSNKTEFVCSGALVGTDYIITEKKLDNLLKGLVGEQPTPNNVKCIDCEYLEFKMPYGVCGKGYMGIVHPDDSCGKGKLEETGGGDK